MVFQIMPMIRIYTMHQDDCLNLPH